MTLDALDAQVLRCLEIAPRARFETVGRALDVAAATVARHYRRLEQSGVARVRGVVAPERLRSSSWVLRAHCRADGSDRVAEELASRANVPWIAVCSGGAEVVCAVRQSPLDPDGPPPALRDTSRVFDLTRSLVLHRFAVPERHQWAGLTGALSDDQERAVAPDEPPIVGDLTLEPDDRALLATLGHDGRASVATLAAIVGVSERRIARRLTELLESGVVQVRLELAPLPLGFAVPAVLWLRVAPSQLDAVGRALAAHPAIMNVSALSGGPNLAARVACRDVAELYGFVTDTIGRIDGVAAVDVSPVVRRVDAPVG